MLDEIEEAVELALATDDRLRVGGVAALKGTLFDRTLRMLELLPALKGDRGEVDS